MSHARKLRRRELQKVQAPPVSPDEREFARRIVAWQHLDDDELVDLAARTVRAVLAKGGTPLAAALAAHIATCNSGGDVGVCTHSDQETAQLLPGAAETRRWVAWLKRGAALLVALLALFSAAPAHAAERLAGAHKIQRRNFGRRRRRAYHHPRGWTRSRRNSGNSRLRSPSRSASKAGSEPEPAKNYYAGSSSKSSWFGGVAASTSARCRETIHSSRSSALTGRWSGRLGLSLGLCLLGCGAADNTTVDLNQLDEEARELAQGCAWHEAPSGFDPWDQGSCWRVYTGAATRVTLEPLRDACDAPQLPRCVLLAGTDKPTAYFDRDQLDAPRIIRYERSALCEACPGR